MPLTPNMNLIESVVGVDSGLTWEENLNADLAIIDGHNHSPGFGVPISPSGMNISSDLTFNNNNATNLKSLRFQSQGSPLSGPSDLGCLYESGVDLWFNDGNGNQIKITSGGSVNATSSGIASGTATASFVSSVLVVNAAANLPANIQGGSILLGNNVVNSKYLTLSPPSAMAANYSITLPTLPSVTNIVTMDSSGNLAANWNVDNSTLQVVSNTIQVSPGGITDTQIASATITSDKFVNPLGLVVSAHIPSSAVSGFWQLSASSTTFVPFNTNANFPTVVIDFNPTTFGTAQTTTGNLPAITINGLVPGYYSVTASFLGDNTAGNILQAFGITDGTTTSGAAVSGVTAVQQPVFLSGVFHYTSSGNRTFSIVGANCVGGGTVLINNDGSASPTVRQLNWNINKIW